MSPSTTFIPGQERILQAALDGIAELPVSGLVTTGPALDPNRLRVPANTQTHRYLPHRDVMPVSSVLVGHGGHAKTMLALAHALPVVIIPVNRKFDQPIIGRAIQDAGAGILLLPRLRRPASATRSRPSSPMTVTSGSSGMTPVLVEPTIFVYRDCHHRNLGRGSSKVQRGIPDVSFGR